MRILKMRDQIRRDFWADLVCESCGHIMPDFKGYDDAYFHDTVIPNLECPVCGVIAPASYIPQTPKYRPDEII